MSTPSASISGCRSRHAPDEQKFGMLFMSDETATSGGDPLVIAALIFVSSMPPETSTVIHGSSSWNRSNIASNSLSSRPLQ